MAKAVQHPGELIESLVLVPSDCSQSRLARQLGFNQPQPVNELINGKRNITPKMALLLEQITRRHYPAEFWLLAQLRWDIAQSREQTSRSRLSMVQQLDGIEAADSGLLALATKLGALD
ncbi:MAG: HigA family addiction module antitoxin [Parahaliea sp.]